MHLWSYAMAMHGNVADVLPALVVSKHTTITREEAKEIRNKALQEFRQGHIDRRHELFEDAIVRLERDLAGLGITEFELINFKLDAILTSKSNSEPFVFEMIGEPRATALQVPQASADDATEETATTQLSM